MMPCRVGRGGVAIFGDAVIELLLQLPRLPLLLLLSVAKMPHAHTLTHLPSARLASLLHGASVIKEIGFKSLYVNPRSNAICLVWRLNKRAVKGGGAFSS